jgi:hypothetical protein
MQVCGIEGMLDSSLPALWQLPRGPTHPASQLLRKHVMIIATRVLKLQRSSADINIPVSLFVPERESDGVWFCKYEIEWPDGKWVSRAGGIDSIQALFLALQMIGTDIYTSNYHKSGQLFVDSPNQGYGFPVPITLRDLMVGDDKKFM